MRKLMYTFLVVFAVFVFASCNSDSSPSYGALTVHAGGEPVARTIEPAVEKVTCVEYCIHMIYKDRNDVPEKTHSFTSTSTTVEGLLAGRWEAYVEGYNDDGTLIAVSESQIITVVQNQYASATFNLEYLSDGTGYMTMSVSIPAAMTDVAKLRLSLEAIDSSHQNYIFTVNRSDASAVGDNLVFSYPADYANQYYEIATGCYDVTLTLISSECVSSIPFGQKDMSNLVFLIKSKFLRKIVRIPQKDRTFSPHAGYCRYKGKQAPKSLPSEIREDSCHS